MYRSLLEVYSELAIDSVSLGMVVIDEIHLPSQPPLIDVAGGSGTYTALGSRLFAAGAQSRMASLVFSMLEDKLSTRGLLEYEDDTFGPKKFRYTTPPLKASPLGLVNTHLLSARAVHQLATPEEILLQIPMLIQLRTQRGIMTRPFIVWEPLPVSCTMQNKQNFQQACRLVHVFSPNHFEMAAIFEETAPKTFQPEKLEAYAQEFSRDTGTTGNGIVIIRAGEHGSLTTQPLGREVWLPPYYQKGASNVVDPTGARNAFLGGFIHGWKASQDVEEASIYASVAASFALEQIGLPSCQTDGDGETWNGVQVMERLAEYKALLKVS
ncbi:putative PfkB family kinase [Pyrenochaeta sp. MPI-SDFR-AT-0127]|nr:putative PfkB family kinase [Pyrenochaeta sp. MPI-SDFR-AT-0127]